MSTFFHLLKLQLDNKSDFLKTASPRRMIISLLRGLFVVVGLTLAAYLLLLRIFMLGIVAEEELLSIVLVATQGISLFFAVGHVVSTLYLCKDNELLLCLPVSANQLFFSKLALIYLKEIAVNALLLLPILVTLGIYSSVGVGFFLALPLFLLILPLLPLVLAAFISLPAVALLGFLRRHTVIATVLLLSSVSAILFGYISLVGRLAVEFDITGAQIETVKRINAVIEDVGARIPIYHEIASVMLDLTKWQYILYFLLATVIVAAPAVLIIRPYYFRHAMSSVEHISRRSVRRRVFRRRSAFSSLFHKEMISLFRSPSDIFQYFLFTLLMPFIVYSYDTLLMSVTVSQVGVNMIAGAHVMVVGILAMLSNIISASAISREGESFYTSKIVPIGYFTQIFAKFTFNAVFTLAALLVTMAVSFFLYPAWQVVLGTLAVALAAIGHIALGIDMDIKNPTAHHVGDTAGAGVSKSTPKSLIIGLIIGFLLGFLIISFSSMKNEVVPYLVIIGLALVFAVYRVRILILRVHMCYDTLEM